VESTKEKGDRGEEQAVRFLEGAGYAVIARNWRKRRGEIDIIAEKDDFLVFAEVKTLSNGGFDTLGRVLDTRKQKRIIETAKCFLSEYRQYNKKYVRFDVLVVNMPKNNAVFHIENAFSEFE
jgi:putative endonuclease